MRAGGEATRMSSTVPIDDWERVRDELGRFGSEASVTEREDAVRVEFDRAHVEVTRGGRVSTGAALHDFSTAGGVALVFDHEAGELRVRGDTVEYRFERP